MAEQQNPFRDVQVVVRPGARKLKILVILLILVCTVTLIALGVVRSRIEDRTQDLLGQAATLEHENADLEKMNEQLIDGGSDIIEKIAREELGLQDPNTVILDPNS